MHLHVPTSRTFPPTRRAFLQAAIVGGAWVAAGAPWFAAGRAYGESSVEGALEIIERFPLNAQTLPGELVQSWITPQEKFYIRTNGNIPELDEATFRLKVEGLVERPLEFSMAELRERFGRRSVLATMQCAGNRRSEMAALRPIDGNQWGYTALGNAEWTGVLLREVLEAAGVQEGAKHVWLDGLDDVDQKGKTIHFGGSVPLEKALSEETLLAFLMNGEPLSPSHGFPLRAVIPGFVGARSVKWLGRIVVADRPSENYFVSKSYKVFPPEIDSSNVDWNAVEPLYELPVNAAICSPTPGTQLRAGTARVEGWAFPSGAPGTRIEQVEVSADGGRNWKQADFTSPEALFCWRLWRVELPVSTATKELLVRATDSTGQAQPQQMPWNFKGYHQNAWHRMPVVVG